MFEEVLRRLEQLNRGVKISIGLPLDGKGYLDRQCPSAECKRHLKVMYEDWRDKIDERRAFCPHCRFEHDSQSWNTPEQQEYVESVGLAHVQGLIDSALQADAEQHNALELSRPRGGLIDISMSMEFTPGTRATIVPLAIAEALRQEFACEVCACRWASLGSSFFCPACGHNSASMTFDRTIATVRAMIQHLPTAIQGFPDPDAAEDTIRHVIEDQLGRLVGAFERLCEALHDAVPPTRRAPKSGNLFQRIDDGSAWWRQAVGVGYEGWLSPALLARLRVLYQRRHLLVHGQGIVDQRYLDRSGDSAYTLSQRIVVRAEDILELTELLETLAAGIREKIKAGP